LTLPLEEPLVEVAAGAVVVLTTVDMVVGATVAEVTGTLAEALELALEVGLLAAEEAAAEEAGAEPEEAPPQTAGPGGW
jgi:hypothetical protein